MKLAGDLWPHQEIKRLNSEIGRQNSVIISLKHDLGLLSGQAASMSNTLADYASKINSLAHYIIDEPTSSSQEAQMFANEALDFIVPKLESG